VLAAEQSARIESDNARVGLEAQNERLRELDLMKDEFVASVSHELRTPLTSIRGYLELVQDGEAGVLTADAKRFLSIVDRNVGRLQRVVGDLLFVAQVNAGGIGLEPAAVDLRQLARETVDAARPQAAEKDVELRVESEDMPEFDADAARLCQVLDNLISNAVKFTPEGGHVILRTFAQPGRAVIEVADDGMGIPAEEQTRLFERFFRTEAATDAAIQGTGLGLAIVQAIVTAHGGEISVESEVGRGTTVRVFLPVPVARQVAA
jgi:two-component system phosphate regulon sensor histidine kinase PhoR